MNRIGNWLTGCSREQRARQVCRPKAECGLSAHVAGGRCAQFPLVPSLFATGMHFALQYKPPVRSQAQPPELIGSC